MYFNSQYASQYAPHMQPTLASHRPSNIPQLRPVQSAQSQPQASMNGPFHRNPIEIEPPHRSNIERLPIDSSNEKPPTASFQQMPIKRPIVGSNSRIMKQILQPHPTVTTQDNLRQTLAVITQRLAYLEGKIKKQKTVKSTQYNHIADETVKAKEKQVLLAEKELEMYNRQIEQLKWEIDRKRRQQMDLEAERYFLQKYGHFGIEFRPLPQGYTSKIPANY